MPPLIASLRPRQWIKNLAVFVGLAFSGKALQPEAFSYSILAFALFCAASSAVYLVNDILDRKRDALHPIKKNRPIAAGKVSPATAMTLSAALAITALIGGFKIPTLMPAIAGYLVLQTAYCLVLKHLVILDVFCIATGFLLRVLAGVWVLEVPLSPWLVACGVQLALFLALCKRRAEIVTVGEGQQRPLLDDYAGPATDIMISVVAASTLVTYALYTLLPDALGSLAPELESRAGQPGMVWTIPFVLYGVLRYLWLVYRQDQGERPEKLLTADVPLLCSVLGYCGIVAWVVYR
jgi:4-hydroxybenzoate polyprenyltransferase